MLWAAAAVAAVLVVAGAVAAFRLNDVRHELTIARDQIDRATTEIEDGHIAPARDLLEQARAQLVKANDHLYNGLSLDVISWLPLVHQNVVSLRTSVGDALTLVSGGASILRAAAPLEGPDGKLNVSLIAGGIPLPAVEDVASQVEQLAGLLPPPTVRRSTTGLLGPVRELQDKVETTVEQRRSQVEGLANGLDLLLDMAGSTKDRRYLIAVANPAEMRGAGGMMLSYGVLSSKQGRFTLEAFGGVDDLELQGPVDPALVHLPADYLARWSGVEPTQLWRNTTMAPDFSLAAPVMETMFATKTGLPLDGVIQIDPFGLAAILRGIGPVQVDGVGEVTADNVVDLTLNKAYVDFPQRDVRQEVLGDVADVVFHTLVSGHFDSVRTLGTALYDAALERHVIFVPDSDVSREHVAFFHADGAFPPADASYAALTIQNFSKNKLDYYIDSSLDITGAADSGTTGSLHVSITVTNSVPSSVRSTYVTGPNAAGEQRGLYRGVVSLYLPTGVTLVGSGGGPSTGPPVLTAEAGRSVVTYDVALHPGESSTVTIDVHTAPRSRSTPYSLELVPVPRVRPTAVAVDVEADGTRAVRPATPLTAVETITAR